jgi:Uma2 family endonuclease
LWTEVGHVAIPVKHRFTVENYHRMAQTGILREDSRVELIEGEIVDMSPIGRKHQACVDRLATRLIRGLGDKAIIRVQGGVRLSKFSEPQPDLALLRWRDDFYAGADAGPEDVLLIVEVAETTLSYDRRQKVPLYARVGITEVWLVDLSGESLTVCKEPITGGYRTVFDVQGDARLSPQAFPEFVLTADQVVGGLS